MKKSLFSSPTYRACCEATKYKVNNRGTPLRLEVKEPWDNGRIKLGKIIHDPSLANELWEKGQVKVKTRPSRLKKKPIINAQMSMEWSR